MSNRALIYVYAAAMTAACILARLVYADTRHVAILVVVCALALYNYLFPLAKVDYPAPDEPVNPS